VFDLGFANITKMLLKTASAVALLAAAGQASASEPAPYKPLMKMSVHQLFGLGGRQASGYQPSQTVCGTGATCAEACGANFVQCASNDGQTHCFEPSLSQTCCPDMTGNSCDAGYYCTQDTTGQTWCCPDGQTLAQCAAAYSITGSLVSETAAPTTTTASSSSITITSASSYGGNATVTTDVVVDTVTTCPSAGTSLSYPGTNSTAAKVTPTTSMPATVPFSGAGLVAPSAVSAFVVVAAAFAAAALL
jgi:hypothetical protein